MQSLCLTFYSTFLQAGNLIPQNVRDRLDFVGKFEVSGDVPQPASQVGVCGQSIFQALALAHEHLGLLRIGPELGISGYFLFNFSQLGAERGRVKDSSAGHGPYRGRQRIRVRVLRPLSFTYAGRASIMVPAAMRARTNSARNEITTHIQANRSPLRV